MCRKDFVGYTCGHCSLPTIMLCPITLSNPRFPPCKYIAEIPMWANTYCDPCRRVAFTQDVLLKEKIHMEEHQKGNCPCGNDLTEEERQRTRARLLAEKERGKGLGKATRSVSGKRQETYQPRKQAQGDQPRLHDKHRSGQQPQVSGNMGHLSQYLNAPYGQRPMQPVPTYQFHQQLQPYHPPLAFPGIGASPRNQYREKRMAIPPSNDTSSDTEPLMIFGESRVARREIQTAEVPDLYVGEVQPVEELPTEKQVEPMAEESSSESVQFICPPVVVSNSIAKPSRPHSCPSLRPQNTGIQSHNDPW